MHNFQTKQNTSTILPFLLAPLSHQRSINARVVPSLETQVQFQVLHPRLQQVVFGLQQLAGHDLHPRTGLQMGTKKK